jgi:CheY-like chemotaxis protein
VDRAADTRIALARLLGAEGYDVHAVDGARRARRLARFTRFDLLVTDLGTPGQPELSLLRDLGGTADGRPAPRGIVATAMQQEDYGGEDALERAGYEAVLLKPIRFEELLSLVMLVTAGATR